MDAISPTDTLLLICGTLILVLVVAVRAANLGKRAWNTGDTIALFFAIGLCFAIAFPNAVLIAV